MAIDSYLVFFPQNGLPLTGESQVDFGTGLSKADPFSGGNGLKRENFVEIEQFAFDIEQTLNISSQSTGAGAGKVQFNPFSVTRKVDVISNKLYLMACQGTPFKFVDLIQRKAGGGETASATFLAIRFGLVAVKTFSLSHDEEAPRENVSFEFGSLQISYAQQDSKGAFGTPTTTGWDRVRNVQVNGN